MAVVSGQPQQDFRTQKLIWCQNERCREKPNHSMDYFKYIKYEFVHYVTVVLTLSAEDNKSM